MSLVGRVAYHAAITCSVAAATHVGLATVHPLPPSPATPPGLRPGDHLLLLRPGLAFWWRPLATGDLVAVAPPDAPRHTPPVLLAVRRLPGQLAPQEHRPFELVGAGRVWVEGSPAGGRDSREWGAVPLALLEGRAAYVVWPPSRWQRVPRQ